MNFSEQFNEKVNEIEKTITGFLPGEEGFQSVIMEAMKYSLTAGGKRLRPLLLSETAAMFGYAGEDIAPFMAAIEMIHTYSLVHDDLPCMDNDLYRRGKKTTHAVYGEDMGVLTGDALLNYAFETALQAFHRTDHVSAVVKAMEILAKKAGIFGMIGGQVIDMRPAEGAKEDRLMEIYRLKTGALLEASMMIGAVLANACDSDVEKVGMAAESLGLAFQIKDDLLDVEGVEEEIGKPLHSDEKNEKLTYVSCFGAGAARKKVEDLTQNAVGILGQIEGDSRFLEQLFVSLIDRRK